MALADLNVSLALVTKDFDKSLRQTERKLNRFSRNLTNIGSNLTTSVTLPLAAVGGTALKTAADFETLRTSFGVLLGDVDRGNRLFQELQDFSASTPFQLQDIAAAAKQLLAFSFSAEETKSALQFLGDIAAGTGSNLGDLALILGQSRAIGAAYTEDLRQLANRGIPVFDLLKERLDLSGEELRKFVSDGKVSFEILQDVLRSTTEAGGLFAGGLAAQSQTLSGLFSTLKDNISIALADIGQSISEAFNLNQAIPALVEEIQQAVAVFRNLDNETKRSIVRLAAFTAAIGPAVFALGKIAGSVSTLIGFGRQLTTFLVSNAGKFAIYTGAANTAEVATKRLNLALKLSFAGIALAAVGLLVGKFLEYRSAIRASADELNAARTAAGAFADVEKEATAAIAERVAKVESLVGVAQDETKAENERIAAIQRLKREYPDYFGKVAEDITKTGQLTTAKDNLTEALLRESRARAAGQKIQEIASQALEIEDKIAAKKAEQAEIGRELAALGFDNLGAAVRQLDANRKIAAALSAQGKSIPDNITLLAEVVGAYQRAGIEANKLQAEVIQLTEAQRDLAQIATQGTGNLPAPALPAPQAVAATPTVVTPPTVDFSGAAGNFQQGAAAIGQAIKGVNFEFQNLSDIGLSAVASGFQQIFSQNAAARIAEIAPGARVATDALGALSERLQEQKERLLGIGEIVGGVVSEGFSSFFSTILEGGANVFDGFISAIKRLVVQLVAAVATAAALAALFTIISGGSATGISGIKSLLGFDGGKSLFGNLFKFPGFAEGGIVPPGFPNDTYPALLTSGERVIPQGLPLPQESGGKLTGEVILRGNDLVIAMERFQNNRTRRRGS